METICIKEKCTGCAACHNICPKEAIQMCPNDCGFLHPEIDNTRCIDCGLCEKICPVNKPLEMNEPLQAMAAISKDVEDLMSSTSGGASSVLAHTILSGGGVVYGCVQRNCKDIAHRRITSVEEAYQLKGSKYVQSIIGNSYQEVKQDLSTSKEVLFTGTPCQIGGLKNYLRKDYPNLYTVDLVCHGVPSQLFLQDNITEIQKKEKLQFYRDNLYVHFRRKGQRMQDLKYGFFLEEKGQTSAKTTIFSTQFPNDHYIVGFMCGLLVRENCFTCPYATRKRVGDLTIADFWGLGANGTTKIDNSRGVSLLLLNTKKGQSLFERIKEQMEYEERTVDEAVKGNGRLQSATSKPANYEAFHEKYMKEGFEESIQEFLRGYFKNYKFNMKVMHVKELIKRIPFLKTIYKSIKR
ncbi:MAG: Coenzyme F420 hydrogenase/dehydrogenase, beta subunit C-terminal domain [Bacteroidaceae bacterium]